MPKQSRDSHHGCSVRAALVQPRVRRAKQQRRHGSQEANEEEDPADRVARAPVGDDGTDRREDQIGEKQQVLFAVAGCTTLLTASTATIRTTRPHHAARWSPCLFI